MIDDTKSSSEQQPMSKSQKKRLKRNKSKQRAEASDQVASASSSPKQEQLQQQQQPQDPLNPHAKLRHDLLSLGYSVEEIDNGMEEMWNHGMQYDELEAVTSFLEDKRELWANEVNVQASVDADDAIVSTEEEKESAAVSEVRKEEDLSACAPNAEEEKLGNQPDETPEDEEVTEDPDDETETEVVPAMDLISKLEVVADFENLQDALFAISEWVNKAAKPDELLDFCGVKEEASSTAERSPFATILKRSIAYIGDTDDYYRTVILPYLHSLLSGVLVGHVETSSVVDQLLNVVYYSRNAITQLTSSSLPSSVPDDISMAVSRLIAALVHKNLASITSASCSSSSSLEATMQSNLMHVSNEMNQMLAQVGQQPPARGNGVVELMTERDCRRCLAEKASDLSKLVLQSLSNENDLATSSQPLESTSHLLQSNDAKLTMFSSLLGEHYSTVQTGVRSYRDTESRIKTLQADLTSKHAEVAAELLRVHSDLQHITRRKNELLLELEQLERNETLLQNREAELNTILTGAESGSEVAFLQSQRVELMGMMRTDDSLRNLVDKMSDFETVLFVNKKAENVDNLQQQVKSSSYAEDQSISAEEVAGKITLLMDQMQNYFRAEAAIIKFLRDRVVNMKMEHKDLQREIVQFKELGLTTNVNQMIQSSDEIKRNISEDESVLSALCLEADKMQTSLYERVMDYVNDPTGNYVLSSSDMAALSNIIQSISRIGVTSQLSSFMPPSDISSNINGSRNFATTLDVPISAPTAISQQSIRRPVPQQHQPPPPPQPVVSESVSLKPMFKWGVRSGAPAEKKEVKSLLDIQKEEMSAKQTTI